MSHLVRSITLAKRILSLSSRNAILDVVLPLGISLFFVASVWPGLFRAYRSFAELWAYGTDDQVAILDLYYLLIEGIVPPLAYPGTYTYGLFPQLLVAVFVGPLIPLFHLFDQPITTAHLVLAMRLTNIGLAVIGIIFCYRLTRLMTGPWWASLASFVMATMFPVAWAALSTKPDMCQMTMGIISVYFMVRFQQTEAKSFILVAALFCGLSAGAKYYNVLFLAPALCFAVLSANWPQLFSLRTFISRLVLLAQCAFMAFAAFILTNFRWLVYYDELLPLIGAFTAGMGGNQFSLLFWQTPWDLKLRLVALDGFIGYPLLVASVVAMIWLTVEDFSQKVSPLSSTIGAAICAFVFLFFIVWNFAPHIRHGWRFLLQTACFLPIPVVVLAGRLVHRYHWGAQVGSFIVVIVACGLVGIQFTPNLAVTSPRLTAYFDYLNERFFKRESDSRFVVREWLRTNVPSGSLVLGQWTTNVASPAAPESKEERIEGLTLRSSFGFITADDVKRVRPDFIVFGLLLDVDGLRTEDPFAELEAVRAVCPAPEQLIPIGTDGETFVMRCSRGRAALGPALRQTVITSGEENANWKTTGEAVTYPDGTASGTSNGQIFQNLTILKDATAVSIRFNFVADVFGGALIIDSVWYHGDQELERKVDSLQVRTVRAFSYEILQRVPASANRVVLSVRPWRPRDGQIKVRQAEISWHRPAAPSTGQWPLF